MIRCQKCGQVNSDGSNFCRFCGIKFAHTNPLPDIPQQPQKQEFQQPQKQKQQPPQRRPYSWKTDEFDVQRSRSARSTQRIEQVRPLAGFHGQTSPMVSTPQNRGLQQRGANMMQGNYRCPRCQTNQLPRVEKKISTGGWVVFAVLLLAFFPLFWIGFLIKEEVHICPVCNVHLK